MISWSVVSSLTLDAEAKMLASGKAVTIRPWGVRIGPALLLVGSISLAQAVGFFPLGDSGFPAAVTLIALGGAMTLEMMRHHGPVVKVSQTVLMLIALAAIIVF